MAFLTAVVLSSRGSDWAEIDLGAEFETSTSLRITCEIQMSCWCNTDHNMRVVEQHGWLVGNDRTLATAFDKAAALGIQWFAADPDHLRVRAGLPTRAPGAS